MLTNLKLIFIHGISSQTTNYSQVLFDRVLVAARSQLAMQGVVGTDADAILRKLVHHEVLWADLTTDVTNRYMQLAYQKPRFFWNHFTRGVDPLGIQIMQYIKDKGDKSSGPMNILREVHNDISRILGFTDIGEDPQPEAGQHALIIGHSLGSVIAFDYAMGFRKPFSLRPQVTVDSFITMGSPLPLFTSAMGHPDSDFVLPTNVHKWVNIRSVRDSLARPLRPFFRNIPIEDYEVKTGFHPLGAHSGYWKSRQTAELIAYEVLQALTK